MKKTQIQFELWEECNSKCSFCYLGNNNRSTPDDNKVSNIEDALQKINNPLFLKNINCIGFIGGEFFQGQLKNDVVKSSFLMLMRKVNELLEKNIIDEMWMSASLLIGDQADLYETLALFKDPSKIWILTSYDTIGRFHSEKEKNNWLCNVQRLRDTYPTIKINITSITTGDFIDKFLADELDLYTIAEKYTCSVFLKPPCFIKEVVDRQNISNIKKNTNDIIGNFFPTRSNMIKFLVKYKQNFSDFLYEKLFNMKYRSEYLYLYGHRQKFSHRIQDLYQEEYSNTQANMNFQMRKDIALCNHSLQYRCYLDSDKCVICDKNIIKTQFS